MRAAALLLVLLLLPGVPCAEARLLEGAGLPQLLAELKRRQASKPHVADWVFA
jgi:hypothetical protein